MAVSNAIVVQRQRRCGSNQLKLERLRLETYARAIHHHIRLDGAERG
jgi:hypothetical protein